MRFPLNICRGAGEAVNKFLKTLRFGSSNSILKKIVFLPVPPTSRQKTPSKCEALLQAVYIFLPVRKSGKVPKKFKSRIVINKIKLYSARPAHNPHFQPDRALDRFHLFHIQQRYTLCNSFLSRSSSLSEYQ